MTRWRTILIITVILLIGQQINGQTFHHFSQDTLVFQKKNNRSKQFKLPLNDYPVFVKQTNKKEKEVLIKKF
jgi:hypothetical protein